MITPSDDVATYVSRLTAAEDEALRHARERAAGGGMPPVSADTGAFLRLATRLVAAKAVVEVGSGAGYSGIWMTRALADGGMLTTIEADPGHQRLALASYQEAGVAGRVDSRLGPGLEVLPTLADGAFDLAFLDAVKSEYPAYLDHALRLVRPGGLILADNVLWSGRVADPRHTDPNTEGLREYTRRATGHPRLDTAVLTIGDGVAVSLVRG